MNILQTNCRKFDVFDGLKTRPDVCSELTKQIYVPANRNAFPIGQEGDAIS